MISKYNRRKSINKLVIVSLILFAALLSGSNSEASNLNVKPGKWLFTVLISNNQTKKPKIEKVSRCFNKSQMNPIEDFEFNQDKSKCDVYEVESNTGKSLEWRWFCGKRELNPKTNGKGVYVSNGSKISGLLKTAHYKKGSLVKTKVSIEGKYVGKCSSDEKLLINY